MDPYRSFPDLDRCERRDADYRVRAHSTGSRWAVIAPHGGGIEPGTSEVAAAVAGGDLSFYAFEGIKLGNNGVLHVTSTRFDEPECVSLVAASEKALAIHGEGGAEPLVFLGGRDAAAMEAVGESLRRHGFRAETHPDAGLQGKEEANICNRCRSGAGVQLELSAGLRRALFQSLSGRDRRLPTDRLPEFVAAVREVIA